MIGQMIMLFLSGALGGAGVVLVIDAYTVRRPDR